jgi:hypothetical protein
MTDYPQNSLRLKDGRLILLMGSSSSVVARVTEALIRLEQATVESRISLGKLSEAEARVTVFLDEAPAIERLIAQFNECKPDIPMLCEYSGRRRGKG